MRGSLFACLILTLTILAVLAHLVAEDRRVSIKVSPHVVMADQAVRVQCRVVRDPANRGLFIGLSPYTSSFEQLDGEQSRVTWEETYAHVPCDVTGAFCDLRAVNSGPIVVREAVTVAGCVP